jgi:hypothetical protein
MNTKTVATLARIAAALSLCAIAACQPAPAPQASAPPEAAAPPPAPPAPPPVVAAPPPYQRILPLPRKASLHDIFVRNGVVVGVPDPTDPTVRILHGYPRQAKSLFNDLTKGGHRVPSSVGTAYRLPGGAVLTLSEKVSHGLSSVTIFVKAPGVPVSELRFHVPPSAMAACLRHRYCEGGGAM